MTFPTSKLPKLIHKPDGSLVSDNPFIVVGTKLVASRPDPDLGNDFLHHRGVITEETAAHNVNVEARHKNRVYADWTTATGTHVGIEYLDKSSVDVIYD